MEHLEKLAQLVRYNILTATTAAGSGHPTSSLSATELLTTLFFNGTFRYDLADPTALTNDRIIFSKGHASPLLYALYAAAGYISHEELLTLRQFDSVLEGHPTPRFAPIEVATGSLGQGLSMGLGMALAFKKMYKNSTKRIPHVYVLTGDSELAEGQVWEAAQVASYYGLNNLIALVDVNRLGQRGPTMDEWNVKAIGARFASFGWQTVVLEDGHDIESIETALDMSEKNDEALPVAIIAKTVKGKGISFLEDQDGWHGKPVPQEKLEAALKELGPVDTKLVGGIALPEITAPGRVANTPDDAKEFGFEKGALVATREAYGTALEALAAVCKEVMVLDAETSNSTFAETVKKTYPDQFVEMFIAEQNMASVAVGLSKLGYVPFMSTFAAFFARAYDQIRMGQYADASIKAVGSHAGVSIGPDGSSQMGLEDLSLMRSILKSVVLYPSDAVSTAKLVVEMHNLNGEVNLSYLRLTREKTPVLYDMEDEFPIGGSKVLAKNDQDQAVIVAAGITLHESMKAYEELKKEGVSVAVVDAYSVKPLDTKTIMNLAGKTGHIIVVEDHYPCGGLGEAVATAMAETGTNAKFTHLAVRKIPRSGTPAELLAFAEIDAAAIKKAVRG